MLKGSKLKDRVEHEPISVIFHKFQSNIKLFRVYSTLSKRITEKCWREAPCLVYNWWRCVIKV